MADFRLLWNCQNGCDMGFENPTQIIESRKAQIDV
jgi:hypothetical protein